VRPVLVGARQPAAAQKGVRSAVKRWASSRAPCKPKQPTSQHNTPCHMLTAPIQPLDRASLLKVQHYAEQRPALLTTTQNFGSGTSRSLPSRCAVSSDARNSAVAVAPWLKPNMPSGLCCRSASHSAAYVTSHLAYLTAREGRLSGPRSCLHTAAGRVCSMYVLAQATASQLLYRGLPIERRVQLCEQRTSGASACSFHVQGARAPSAALTQHTTCW
jgi:hypothetical protein